MIRINIKTQDLEFQGKTYLISTAKNGVGDALGSFCTPSGYFRVVEKIGAGLEVGAVLVGREPTGEIYSQNLAKKYPDRDWILTRILWLDGVDTHNQNTKIRYIYIHGTPEATVLGEVGSKGCIRMGNTDMIELFNQVEVGELVLIQ